jgi:prepilin-type N-terminal cleavage/methylation domain-containing protein
MSLPKNEGTMTLRKMRGFSLPELMISMTVLIILASFAAIFLTPVTKQQHVTTAYNDTLATLRRARDQAAGDMRTYVVTITLPGTITVQQSISASGTCQIPPTGTVLLTTVLPSDITFNFQTGFPTSNTTAPMIPDQFGTPPNPVDLDENNANPGATTICFNPDGTASDALGNISDGVVYLGRPGDLYSGRAFTIWGSTGRVRGWRLYNESGNNTWSEQ